MVRRGEGNVAPYSFTSAVLFPKALHPASSTDFASRVRAAPAARDRKVPQVSKRKLEM